MLNIPTFRPQPFVSFQKKVQPQFGNHPCMNAVAAGEELEKLLKNRGLHAHVVAIQPKQRRNTYHLILHVNKPDTPCQVIATLKELQLEGFVQQDNNQFRFRNYPVKFCEDYAMEGDTFQRQASIPRNECE